MEASKELSTCFFSVFFVGGETIRGIINMTGAHVELNRTIPESSPTKSFIIRGIEAILCSMLFILNLLRLPLFDFIHFTHCAYMVVHNKSFLDVKRKIKKKYNQSCLFVHKVRSSRYNMPNK